MDRILIIPKEKKKVSFAPAIGLCTIIVKYVYLYIADPMRAFTGPLVFWFNRVALREFWPSPMGATRSKWAACASKI